MLQLNKMTKIQQEGSTLSNKNMNHGSEVP